MADDSTSPGLTSVSSNNDATNRNVAIISNDPTSRTRLDSPMQAESPSVATSSVLATPGPALIDIQPDRGSMACNDTGAGADTRRIGPLDERDAVSDDDLMHPLVDDTIGPGVAVPRPSSVCDPAGRLDRSQSITRLGTGLELSESISRPRVTPRALDRVPEEPFDAPDTSNEIETTNEDGGDDGDDQKRGEILDASSDDDGLLLRPDPPPSSVVGDFSDHHGSRSSLNTNGVEPHHIDPDLHVELEDTHFIPSYAVPVEAVGNQTQPQQHSQQHSFIQDIHAHATENGYDGGPDCVVFDAVVPPPSTVSYVESNDAAADTLRTGNHVRLDEADPIVSTGLGRAPSTLPDNNVSHLQQLFTEPQNPNSIDNAPSLPPSLARIPTPPFMTSHESCDIGSIHDDQDRSSGDVQNLYIGKNNYDISPFSLPHQINDPIRLPDNFSRIALPYSRSQSSLPSNSSQLSLAALSSRVPAPPNVSEYTPFSHNVNENHVRRIGNEVDERPISTFGQSGSVSMKFSNGRRRIVLRIQEDIRNQLMSRSNSVRMKLRDSFLGHIRGRSSLFRSFNAAATPTVHEHPLLDDGALKAHDLSADRDESFGWADRGTITVSWFDGTSSFELYEHVKHSLIRKINLEPMKNVDDIRILDESVHPPEEIVLSPYIPDGSHFLLRFARHDAPKDGAISPGGSIYSQSTYRAPVSPSAAPSPVPSNSRTGLNAQQIALLQKQLHDLATPALNTSRRRRALSADNNTQQGAKQLFRDGNDGKSDAFDKTTDDHVHSSLRENETTTTTDIAATTGSPVQDQDAEDDFDEDIEDDLILHSEDPIEGKLRQILMLLTADKVGKTSRGEARRRAHPYEKRQVIFLVANYFVLFLSLVAMSAEIQARSPEWMAWMEAQLKNVQDCAKDQEALFQCISNGDYAGLIASIFLWLSRFFANKKVFLFGFESTKQVWNVVYESFITSLCWGISYLFIRRGMNPDTRHHFIKKYWKDAVYGSLAGFNAAFLKQILKNLIPKEAVEDAWRERQLRILKWFPIFD